MTSCKMLLFLERYSAVARRVTRVCTCLSCYTGRLVSFHRTDAAKQQAGFQAQDFTTLGTSSVTKRREVVQQQCVCSTLQSLPWKILEASDIDGLLHSLRARQCTVTHAPLCGSTVSASRFTVRALAIFQRKRTMHQKTGRCTLQAFREDMFFPNPRDSGHL